MKATIGSGSHRTAAGRDGARGAGRAGARPAGRLGVWALLFALLSACEGPRRPEEGTFWKGERDRSPSVRASNARPTPGDGASHPLDTDRFGIDAAMERRRSEHERAHGEGSLRIEGFSHPACAGLDPARRRRCPLLAVRWGPARACEGGVELELRSEVAIAELRRELLCHRAQGAVAGETRCPLHVEGVRVESERRGERWVFRLVTGHAAVAELRERVRRLLR